MCPKLRSVRQDDVREWLMDRETYEENLQATCKRRGLDTKTYMQTWKECFEDKRMLKQVMVMRELEGEPKDLEDKVLEAELRKIVGMPKNGVEADITNLFYGIHMDMKDDDVMSRVVKFLARCDERMDARVMKAHLERPDMRKKIFKRLLDHVDPEAVRDACVLEMDRTWHATDFDWAAVSKLIMLHAKEQQRFYSTYGAGRKKPNPTVKNVRGKASTTEFEEDLETGAAHPTTVVTHRVTDAATRVIAGSATEATSATSPIHAKDTLVAWSAKVDKETAIGI
ncbi:hypothetical protein H310_13355 [Aphanomyces invadans]|uniref:Uncharacterized protein n=1 Tax=Aphanomyces invadans TaxID=157072 RepID=A0A024TG21_9STRA|nr:hypothetical protein H310_13355 [Aphanomyces invadans]ETV92297.1 hypothetical protein H310_13355 [Aphanomyces invadans]|eukprot:XP_008879048.1 hypothetical protein H310_13355 [Aphanomyces invadans]